MSSPSSPGKTALSSVPAPLNQYINLLLKLLTVRQTRAARGFGALSALFLAVFVPVLLLARKETYLVRHLLCDYKWNVPIDV